MATIMSRNPTHDHQLQSQSEPEIPILRVRLHRLLHYLMQFEHNLHVPATHSATLRNAIFTPEEVERGHLVWVYGGPPALCCLPLVNFARRDLLIYSKGEDTYSLAGNWAGIFQDLKISKKAVISLWLVTRKDGTRAIRISHDGDLGPFRRVPPLPAPFDDDDVAVYQGWSNGCFPSIDSLLSFIY